MLLFGTRSHARFPSPVPRIDSGKIWISIAWSVPSVFGVAAVPIKLPGLISDKLALATEAILALSTSRTLADLPSRSLTSSVFPSTRVIVPRTFIDRPAAKRETGLRAMIPAITICMLLRPGFIFHIRRFGGAPVIKVSWSWVLIWEFFAQEAACAR